MEKITLKLPIRAVLIIFFLLIKYELTAQMIWPTNGPANVGSSFGSNGGSPYQYFHDGIDIPGNDITSANPTKIRSIINNAIIWDVQQTPGVLGSPNRESIDIILRFNLGNGNYMFGCYVHCDELPGLFDFYDGSLINNTIVMKTFFSNHQTFVNTTDYIAGLAEPIGAKNIYSHVHFMCFNTPTIDPLISGGWDDPNKNLINPLSILNNNDPHNSSPNFGPLFISKFLTTEYFTNNPIYSKIKIKQEITDNMGWEYPATKPTSTTSKNWYSTSNILKNYITSTPYQVSFQIQNKGLNTINSWNEKSLICNGVYPTNSGPDGFENLFDDEGPSGNEPSHYFSLNGIGPLYHYCYDLTNIADNPPFDEKYWNTKLKAGAFWNSNTNASIIDEAEYPDGEYHLITKAGDFIHLNNQDISVNVDNFKPYLKFIEIRKGSQTGPIAYQGEWIWNGLNLQLTPTSMILRLQQYVSFSDDVYFVLKFSEEMNPLSVSVGVPSLITSPANQYAQLVIAQPNHKDFVYMLPASSLAGSGGLQNVGITGNDIANNSLLTLSESSNYYSLPNRDDAGQWQGLTPALDHHFDFAHHFMLGCVNGGNRIAQRVNSMTSGCMDAYFEETATGASWVNNQMLVNTNTQIDFTDLTAPNAASWLWDFGDGTTSTLQNPSHVYTIPQTYTVSLTATSGSESDTEEKTSYIVVTNNVSTYVNIDFIPSSTNIPSNGMVSFTNNCVGLSANATYLWTFDGQSADQTDMTPLPVTFINSSPPTGWGVILTVTDGATTYAPVTKRILVDAVTVGLSVYVPTPTQPNPSDPFTLQYQAVVSGGTPPYSFQGWEYSDQPGVITLSNVHSFPGNTTSATAKACYTDASSGIPECDIRTTSIVAASANITSLDHVKSIDYGNCQGYWDFEVHYSITPFLIIPDILWKFVNVGNPANNFTVGPNPTPFDHEFLGGGNWEVTVEVQVNGGVLDTYTELITNCPAASNAITFFDESPTFNGCFSGSFYYNDPNPVDPVLDFQVDNSIAGWPDDYTTFISNGVWYSGGNCNHGGGSAYELPCFNTQITPQVNFGNPSFVDIGDGLLSHYNLLVTADKTNNPFTVTAILRVHKPIDSDGDGYYDYEDKIFTGTYYHCLTAGGVQQGNDRYICPGSTTQLGGNTTVTQGTPGYTYTWTSSQGSTFNLSNPANPIYTARAFNSGETYYDDLVTLTVDDSHANTFPVQKTLHIYVSGITASPVTENICIDTQNKHFNVSPSGGSNNYSYQWSPMQTLTASLSCNNCPIPIVNPIAPTTAPAIFSVTITDATGCSATTTASVNVTASSVTANAGSDIAGNCPGAAVTLQGSFSNATDPANVTWEWHKYGNPASTLFNGIGSSVSSFNLSPPPTDASAFVFRVNDGGCYAEDFMYVLPDHSKGPQVNAGEDQYFCTNGIPATLNFGYQLEANTTFDSESWTGTPVTPNCPTTPCNVNFWVGENIFTYMVKASDGCIGTDQVRITFNPINFYPNQSVFPCKGTSTPLLKSNTSVIYPGLAPPYSYEWSGPASNLLSSTNIENPNFTADQSAAFTVTVTDARGCSNTSANFNTAYIVQQTEPDIEIELAKSCVLNPLPHEFIACFNVDEGMKVENMGVANLIAFTNQFSSSGSVLSSPPTESISGFVNAHNNCNIYNQAGNTTMTYTVTSSCGTKSVTKNFTINPIHTVDMEQEYLNTDQTYSSIVSYQPPYVYEAEKIDVGDGLPPTTMCQLITPWEIHTLAVKYIYFTEVYIESGCEFTADIIPCSYYDPAAKPVIKDTLIVSHDTPPINSKQVVPENESNQLTEVFKVSPNPTTGNVTINIGFQKEKEAVLFIEDQLGHLLDRINLGKFASTIYSFNMGKYGVENQGIYYLKLLADDKMQVKKLVLLK